MGLTLITGRANAGKTGVLYRVLAGAARERSPVLLLPQAPDVRRAQREFAERALSGIRSAVLDDWIRELWTLHGDGRRLIGPAARVAVLTRVAQEAQLDVLAESASSCGFAQLIAELVRHVWRAQGHASDPMDSEIGLILENYRASLVRLGMIEFSEAAELLAGDPPACEGPIAVNRFTDVSPTQESFLVALAAVTDVHIALTWSESAAPTEAVDPLVQRLLSAGAAHVVVTDEARTDEGLAALEAAVFEQGPALPTPRSLELGEATGPEAECALVARAVKESIDSGCEPGGIAVAFRDVAKRAHMLTAALEAEGVDAVLDIAQRFQSTPYGVAFLSLVMACRGGVAAREQLLAFLSSPYCGASGDDVAELDRWWRRRRTRDRDLARTAIERLPAAGEAVGLSCGLTGRAMDDTVAHRWQGLAGLLLDTALRRRGLHSPEAEMDCAAHAAVIRAVGELAELGAGATDSDLIVALQAAGTTSGGSEDPDRVLVTEAHRLKGRRFDTVIIGGLNADEFAPPGGESLADELAVRLRGGTAVKAALGERLLFYTMITRARRRLVLVRQTADERGEPTRASVFWDEVLDVYRDPDQTAEDVSPRGLRTTHLTADDLVRSAPSMLHDGRARRRDAAAGAPIAPGRGRLSDHAQRTLAERDEFGVTEIETYLSCPYRWFFRHVVRPREIDRQFDARERGSRAHEILGRFYCCWHDAGRGRVCADDVDEALVLLERVADECDAEPRGLEAQGIGDELSTARARAWARNIILDDVGFLPGMTPQHHELRFGSRHGVDVRLWTVGLSGSIDRIDVGTRGLVVVDYKSSATLRGHKTFGSHGLVQAPVYAAVASHLLGKPVLGATYRSLRTLACRGFWDGDMIDPGARAASGDLVDSAGVQAVIEEAAERVREAVEGMRSGRIAPEPLTAGACSMCDARTVCGEAR